MKKSSLSLRTLGLAAGFALSAVAFPSPGFAVDTTTTFQVTATVNASCTVGASTHAFGVHSSASTTNATSTVTATCTPTTPYELKLDAGTGAGATLAVRKMTGGVNGDLLNYALYRDAARTEIWGDGTASTFTVSGTGDGTAQASTVYGQIPASQNIAPDAYTDTITVTLTY